ncbi:MAG: metal-dependent transcriptional regulator [Oscillospiraceae bacterium]|nr:metal-dependent transcriptional regulator [Oscillospiraceae bacterium]
MREAGENYLETILILERKSGPVRSIDVAEALGVSRPSVNKAVSVLKKAGMVDQQPYGRISLTERGREKAAEVLGRHNNLKRFLTIVLGVGEEAAEVDACRMEHVISEETGRRLAAYIGSVMSRQGLEP